MGPRRRSSRRFETRSQRAARRQSVWGWVIIGAVLVVTALIVYGYQSLDRVQLDARGCPENGGDSITVVIIDGSDPITPRQQAFLRNHLNAIKADIAVGGALEVYRLGVDMESLLEPLVSACNPGRGRDVDPLTGSQVRAEKVWREVFEAPIQEAFTHLLDPSTEAWSPIFESVQSVAITTFAAPGWQERPKRLILVSDLLQYTPDFSHYRGPGEFETFRTGRYYQRVRTDLRGVEVTNFYLPRQTRHNVQGREHLDFWKAYFIDQGARPGRPAFFVHVEG